VRLNGLVAAGLFTRVEYQQHPVRHEYRLTDKGREVYPILAAMAAWGDRWLTGPEGTPLVLHHQRLRSRHARRRVCNECRAPLDVRNVTAHAGPGFPRPARSPATGHVLSAS